MLMGLKEPLAEGGQVPLTLTFEQAGDTTVEAEIMAVGAMSPVMDHGDHE
jgi:hypothetical protein